MNWKYVKKLDGPSVIGEVEAKLGLKLPKNYIKCATANNGGRPERSAISDNYTVKALVRIDKNADLNLVNTLEILSDRLSTKTIPFAGDAFGNYFCFDFEKSGDPQVVFWDHENGSITPIANSFDEFISMLK